MMARPKASYERQPEARKTDRSGQSFTALMAKIDVATFNRMVIKAGLPDSEARELCESFRALKG